MSKNEITTIQAELSVTRKEYITPHFIRIFLTGQNIGHFANTTVGINNKILIPPNGTQKIYFPEFDYEKMQWKPQATETQPIVRTYTHSGIDLERNEIWIDFVAHGDEGPASSWAISSKPGDVLGVLMKNGKLELYPNVDHYLLVADATGIPVIKAILEDLPITAKGSCIIEVHGKEDEQVLKTNASINFIWLYNQHPQKGSLLAETVKQQQLPEDSRFAYVAAEFTTVKNVRHYLRKENNWKQNELNAYSYWKSGVAEDKSVKDRHLEKNTN